MIKILIISFLAIALAGCSTPPGLKTDLNSFVPGNELVAAANTVDTDNIEEESLNGLDDSQEVDAVEADGEVEANELANEQEPGENLLNGGHQDPDNTDNTDVENQLEGVE